jgi:hypothetical protein
VVILRLVPKLFLYFLFEFLDLCLPLTHVGKAVVQLVDLPLVVGDLFLNFV